jgi:EmrB/QacA subfamily drug resistance transporter
MTTESPVSRAKWWALAAAGMGSFSGTLDGNVVKIALPAFTQVFNVNPNTVVWLVLVNYMTVAGLMLTIATVADRVGRKKVFTAGFAVLAVALSLAPLAQNISQLIAFRALQGVGSAMISAVAVAIVISAFSPAERGKALGVLSITVGSGITLGPLFGGFLVDTLGWPSIFYARIPLAVAGLVLCWVGLKDETASSPNQTLDIPGALLLLVFVILLVLGINQGQARGWSSTMVLGMLLLAGTVFVVLYISERSKAHPAVDFSLLKDRLFAGALFTMFFRNLSQMIVLVGAPFYLVQARLFSSSKAGVFVMLLPLGLLTFGPLMGWLSDRLSPHRLSSTGVAVMFAGFLLLSRLDMDSSNGEIALALIIVGVGLGIFEAPNIGMMMGVHSRDKMNAASAMISTLRQLSHAMGVAIGGAILTSRQLFHSSILAGQITDPALAHRLSVAGAFRDAMLVTAALGLTAVLTSFIRGKGHGTPDRQQHQP